MCYRSGGSVNLMFEATGLVVTGSKDDVQQACRFLQSNYLSKTLYDTLEVNESGTRKAPYDTQYEHCNADVVLSLTQGQYNISILN